MDGIGDWSPPLPLDPSMTLSSMAEAVKTAGAPGDPQTMTDVLLNGAGRLISDAPMKDGMAIADAWCDLTSWRAKHPRAGLRIVVSRVSDAIAFREAGHDATTLFAHARSGQPEGMGLVLAMDIDIESDVDRLLHTPEGVRLIFIDDPARMPGMEATS
jgi:hypothetical protein